MTGQNGTRPAAQAKAEQGLRLSRAFDHIAELPTQVFPAIGRPTAPNPPIIDEAAIRRAHQVLATEGIPLWDRVGRKRAKAEAGAAALREVSSLKQEYAERRAQWQIGLDRAWDALGANDCAVVLATLAAAFEDNEAPAAAVGVADDVVSLAVLVPRVVDAVPERKATTTAAGNLSLKKLTKRETAEVYAMVVSGHVLATVKECFAVARGARSAKVVAIRPSDPDVDGRSKPEAVVAVHLGRDRLEGIRWESVDASTILAECSSELHWRRKGAAKELHPLDLHDHPDVQAVVEAIDFGDVAATGAAQVCP